MVKQYLHTLTVTATAAATKNGSGNWVPGSETTVDYACRAEPSKGNVFVTGDDGEKIYYEWVVYLPLPVNDFVPGTSVTLKNGASVLSSNQVKRFSRGQLNARIWL